MDDFDRGQPDAPQSDQAAASASFDFFGLLLRRWWLMAIGLSIGLFVGYIIYRNSDPAFSSFARLTVSRRGGDGTRGNAVDYQAVRKTDLELEAVRLGSPVTVIRAMQAGNLASLDSFKHLPATKPGAINGEVLSQIVRGIQVTKGDPKYEDADVLNLSYRSSVAADCPKVISAIIDSYRAELQGTYENSSSDARTIYNKMREDAARAVKQAEEEFRKLISQSPDLITGESNQTAATTSLLQADAEFKEANRRAEDLRRMLQMAQKKLAEGTSRVVVLNWLISESPSTDWKTLLEPQVAQEREQVNTTLLDLQATRASLVEDFGPRHPDVKAIDARIKLYQAKFPEGSEGVAAETGPVEEQAIIGLILETPLLADAASYTHLFNDRLVAGGFFQTRFVNSRIVREASQEAGVQQTGDGDFLDQRLQSLNIAVQNAALRRDEALGRRVVEGQRAKLVAETVTQLTFLSQTIKDQRKQLDIAVDKLAEIDLMPKTGFLVNVITEPGLGFQIAPSLPLNLVLGGLVGTLLGLGLGFLIDRADQSFRSPVEIRRTLGLPVVGQIPVFFPRVEDEEMDPADSVVVDKMICTYNDPDSIAAEAYRAVRTNLYFSTHGESHKVIQITSPSTDDGKSTLAANLAVSLAQSGVKVLIMDADFRRPRVHTEFGIEREQGLSNLIRGAIDLPDAIHRSPVENLDVMPAGPRPRNPSELLTLPRFKDLLATVRDRYDFVIIDSPPMLAVTDPGAIAARVDGVLLALQIRRKARPSATRAVEILNELGANLLGIVVNGVGWKRAYTYRDGGNFGSGSRFYKYTADFRGVYLLGDSYAYSNAAIEPGTNGELLDDTIKQPERTNS